MGFLSRRHIAALLALALAAGPLVAAGPTEYEVKAVFLFNFTQFVDWPASAFASPTSPLVIGVLGEDPFGQTLDEAVAGETVNGRPLAVRRYHAIDEIEDCHILFINPPTQRPLPAVLESLRAHNVLTVSDSREFARAGGVIEFVTVDNKIRLQINLDAAKLANLTISSKLLKPARIVKTG
jgi:hypothetical protein